MTPLDELLDPNNPPSEITDIIDEINNFKEDEQNLKDTFNETLPVREEFTKAADANEVTQDLTSKLQAAINREDVAIQAINDRIGQINDKVNKCLASPNLDANGLKACQQLQTALADQQQAVAELIRIQRVSFSEEIPNFHLQRLAAQGTALALAFFGTWWLILAFRRERIWIDDELCNNCTACYMNEPAIFQLMPFNKVRLAEKSWQKAINDDNYHDRAEKQVEECQQSALSLTRFVPRRIKKQDDQNN